MKTAIISLIISFFYGIEQEPKNLGDCTVTTFSTATATAIDCDGNDIYMVGHGSCTMTGECSTIYFATYICATLNASANLNTLIRSLPECHGH